MSPNNILTVRSKEGENIFSHCKNSSVDEINIVNEEGTITTILERVSTEIKLYRTEDFRYEIRKVSGWKMTAPNPGFTQSNYHGVIEVPVDDKLYPSLNGELYERNHSKIQVQQGRRLNTDKEPETSGPK